MGVIDGRSAPERATMAGPWRWLLTWSVSAVVVNDVLWLARAELAPLLAAMGLASLLGIVLLHRWRRLGAALLLVASALALTGAPAMAIQLADPASGVDFLQAIVGLFGRGLVIVAAIGTWRRAGSPAARRLGTAAIGLLGVAVVVAASASLLSSSPLLPDADPPDRATTPDP